MDKDQLDGLIALKAVAEKKSFTAAADTLKVSAPAMSKMIAQLERKMGITLMTRTTRTVSLTEAGKAFLDQVGPAIDTIITAQDNAQNFAKTPSGVLRINIPGVVYPFYLAPIIKGFSEQYPEITVDIYADDHASNIFEHGFDAGVRDSEILAKDMVAIKLFGPIKYVTAAAPAYLKKMGRPKHPRELLSHNCIGHRFGPGDNVYRNWEFEEKGKSLEVKVNGNLILNDSLLIREAAKEGAGVIYSVYDVLRKDIHNKELELILEPFHASSTGYYLYFPSRSQVSPKFRVFIDYLKRHSSRSGRVC